MNDKEYSEWLDREFEKIARERLIGGILIFLGVVVVLLFFVWR
jgi:hypothetical protein